jgi:hypothetical protein
LRRSARWGGPWSAGLFEVLGYAVVKLGVFCADVRLSLPGSCVDVVRFLKRELKLLAKVGPSASAAHVIQFVNCKFAIAVVGIGHVIPLSVSGETVPAAMNRVRDAFALLCDFRHIRNPGTPGVKYDRRDAGDGISWAGAPLGKKHPATGDGVKVREETPKGKITPAREMDHAAIPPAEL